jgi:hypothetical protein
MIAVWRKNIKAARDTMPLLTVLQERGKQGAHVRCFGKESKQCCTPLAAHAIAALQAWLEEPCRRDGFFRTCMAVASAPTASNI